MVEAEKNIKPGPFLINGSYPKAVTGGRKNANGIAFSRLDSQQKLLSENLKSIQEDSSLVEHSGKSICLLKCSKFFGSIVDAK
jgi:hypothetical protein